MNKIKPAVINDIKGVFFDYGGVIEEVEYKEIFFRKGIEILRKELNLLDIDIGQEALYSYIKDGLNKYSAWYIANNYIELPNEDLWSNFLLSDIASKSSAIKDKLRSKSDHLSSILEFYLYFRRPVRGIFDIFKTIFNMGYVIALISNTISNTLVPERLEKLNIKRFFSSIVLSVDVGFRKPRKDIFEIALKNSGLFPEQCIYVGDTLSRDVLGSKNAGFSKSILIPSKLTDQKDKDFKINIKPDIVLHSLNELLNHI